MPHRSIDGIICRECGNYFETDEEYRLHKEIHHNEQKETKKD
ncbi:hypothetical protein [Methanonatronarchaeum sp. AMET-Sl]|nr:hypothetical protein [Methanonatronarchaeum sp. AMET-Sl]WGI18100.1 hypothetical protein QEN48_03610 [Methanonatronarchaeum sp. AMET-Sl]